MIDIKKLIIFVLVISVISHIQYLIVRHDCVVVPGFGAFVTAYTPARLSGGVMLPPHRDLGFNPVLVHDDGLLASSVARREGVSYDAARKIVAQDVESLHRVLEADGSLDMPRVGCFTRTSGGEYIFEPYDSGLESILYAGLPVITIPQQGSESEVLETEPVVAPPFIPGRFGRTVRAVSKYAAVLLGLAVIGITATTPVWVDNSSVDLASLSLPAVTAPKPVVLPVVVDTVAVAGLDEEHKTSSLPDVVPAADMTDADADNFSCFVIVASCASAREAQRFIASQGVADGEMKVLHRDGRYRVYVAAGNDYDSAFAYRVADAGFAARHPNAWVYKKRSV